ncbi:TetR/AcrR family transcriptional regulator [Microbacterium sp. TPD7012]|uniref:TetR/AcrR family transcriptional regulator n=1 Tax=Microbacterium sp. TPD7012 TaxID=2171975 RepID=UPI000D51FCED|nr:TetR/AcrR family transcriptional regulator [Microbacterium sp. TPD7012]PVE91600.1 TetR family transcriptional regulator [Microbacterium sp. TPD7012]
MGGVTSSTSSPTAAPRTRKLPEERREDILACAAAIAIEEGLERITLRAVAARLGVRPGLITHYFPVAEDLVVAAFARAAVIEREQFFTTGGTPLQRLARFVDHVERGRSLPLARLWLNARHLSRFSPTLDAELQIQDALDRERLTAMLDDGVASGDFPGANAEAACIRILIALDGGGSYVNSSAPIEHPAHTRVVADVAEWALGLKAGALRVAIAALPT